MIIRIEKLETPIHEGDWHDPPSRWQVIGPNKEIQRFSTKAQAQDYARLRRHCRTQLEAILRY